MPGDKEMDKAHRRMLEKVAREKPRELKPGTYTSMPADEYHAPRLGVVSKSALDQIARSPAHYRCWLEAPDQDTPALSFGRLFHTALLEPHELERYVTVPNFGDCRFKANKQARDEWRSEHAGMTWIEDDSLETAQAMVRSVRAHPLAGKMIADGTPEETVVWRDKETGLLCKMRADYRVKSLRMVVDAKSCEDASEDGFAKSVCRWRYHVQDALYRAGYAAAGEEVEHFVFLAVEKRPPYAVGVYTLDADSVGRGYVAARRGIETMAECMSTGEWPAYPARILELSLPPWAA